ncbi:MAG: arylesterase [Proteobacteria bacterium]|nr:arylesterase [Pseudomonadota bacterium]
MVNCPPEVLTDFPRSFVLIIARITKIIVALYCLSASQHVLADTLLVYGDSISAAYGMNEEQGWVSLLADRLAIDHPHYKVINASESGETTGGGVTRLPKTLEIHQPDILVLELGGNDGLRGYPISKIRENLQIMILQAKASGARLLLIGMVLPPNYGRRYTLAFEEIFSSLAQEHSVPLVPFLLDGISTGKELVQRDGIHPTVEAQPKLLEDVWPFLVPIL